MKQVIDGHNKAILKNAQNPEENQPKKMCNCRNEKECLLEGECLQNEIVYQATVTTRGVTGTTGTSALQQQISKQGGATTKCLLSMRKGGTTPS